jgi:hypothetical protein
LDRIREGAKEALAGDSHRTKFKRPIFAAPSIAVHHDGNRAKDASTSLRAQAFFKRPPEPVKTPRFQRGEPADGFFGSEWTPHTPDRQRGLKRLPERPAGNSSPPPRTSRSFSPTAPPSPSSAMNPTPPPPCGSELSAPCASSPKSRRGRARKPPDTNSTLALFDRPLLHQKPAVPPLPTKYRAI